MAVLLTGAACARTVPGTATLAPVVRQSDELPGYGAPKVEKPLDIDYFLANPCAALTDAQIVKYYGEGNVKSPKLDEATGPECRWYTPKQGPAGINIIYPDIHDLGLTALYDSKYMYAFLYELEPVDGYPVVAYGILDERAEGECALRIGTSDRATIDVTIRLGERKIGKLDPCEDGRAVAVDIIRNIKARN
ncbi:hypothetical protein FHU38_004669 [Saccharomonospora amisosensis]|uniref:DUF3558 domain-containing protein n=1 Tax=Saccharomonospora amisosensis TaxID=1128677 RepID=A0A7X5UUE4_9PSEU|nr:DUF3558 domain-containing protein [Saccharomonospora amisosensis]NIJ14325.1 hypothetical protein [Saccharomonospora amisosensis]